MVPSASVLLGSDAAQAQIRPQTSRNPPPACCIYAQVSVMTRSDWSTADESAWRTAALRWFLAHGVEANLAEDLTQEALLRLLRGQQRGQPLTRAYLHCVCQSVLYDHLRQCAREFYKDAAHKAGAQRRELDITPCFAALLRWIVRLWTPPHKCLALALYQSPSQSSQKTAVDNPLLKVPPASRGNRTHARGSPREAGGTLRRGAIVNFDCAVGIRRHHPQATLHGAEYQRAVSAPRHSCGVEDYPCQPGRQLAAVLGGVVGSVAPRDPEGLDGAGLCGQGTVCQVAV
jgi:hypothetical protein